jgi:hypothetical protein
LASEADHIVAIVNTFVQARYRERLQLKPRQFVDDLFHDLPPKLDAQLVVPVDSLRKRGRLVKAVRAISGSESAWLICGFAETKLGEMPLSEAFGEVDKAGAAVASIEMGEVALYKSEVTLGRHGWGAECYLLVKDAKRRERVAKLAAEVETMR